jgi:FKBP-type peptidyl-prolyl cis-trans isomerase FklB
MSARDPSEIRMNPKCALLSLAVGLATAAAVAAPPARAQSPATGFIAAPAHRTPLDRHKLSYAIGYRIGSRFADGHPQVDLPTLIQALRDAFGHRAPSVSMRDMRQQLVALDHKMRDDARAAFNRLARENARKSAAFLAANKSKPGVVTLPSGVQYQIERKGSGAHPTQDSTVVVNYRGSLGNGMEFDSSYAHGHPVSYPVSKMLPGWRDVLPRMRVGAKWKVVIPPSQAYGEHGQLPRIGPNEVLVFEIELLAVK